MLFIYYSICRAYCLFLDHLLSGAIRYLWSTKDIIYAGPKMLKKWFYWVVIGRRIFLFHDLLLFAIFTHQSIVFQDGRSHHKDSVRSHIHKVTVLQKNSGSCVVVDDTIYVNCVSVFVTDVLWKKWIRICNHHDVKCYKFVKYIPYNLGEKNFAYVYYVQLIPTSNLKLNEISNWSLFIIIIAA